MDLYSTSSTKPLMHKANINTTWDPLPHTTSELWWLSAG